MRRVAPNAAIEDGPGQMSDSESESGASPRSLVARPEPMRTEFDFELPRGLIDGHGVLQKTGTMRLATARDELLPLHDDRVRDNPAYLTVVLLARVITRLGTLEADDVRTTVIENLFASDLAFLQDLYRRINTEGHTKAAVTCPACKERFTVDLAGGRLGES